jgi:hypothetical protein
MCYCELNGKQYTALTDSDISTAAATVAAIVTVATVTTQQYHVHIFKLSNTTGSSITTA